MEVWIEMGREEAGGIETAWTVGMGGLNGEAPGENGRKSCEPGAGVTDNLLDGPPAPPAADPVPVNVPNEDELLDVDPLLALASFSAPSWLPQSSPLSSYEVGFVVLDTLEEKELCRRRRVAEEPELRGEDDKGSPASPTTRRVGEDGTGERATSGA